MEGYNLKIAGYNIRLVTGEAGIDLLPSERFTGNISVETDSDISITVFKGPGTIPPEAIKAFSAPLVEEIDGKPVKKSDRFWEVYRNQKDLFIKTIFPYSGHQREGILHFSLTTRDWQLYLPAGITTADPLDYPLDGLVIYYLTVMNGDILIHASGVSHFGHGYIFSGVSGQGKTTMAGLWNKAGSKVIHDDRLVLRRSGDRYLMYNTPVYRNDEPLYSPFSKIFLIGHGKENTMEIIGGAKAVSMILANCIQHNYDPETVARLMGSVSIMCSDIPVYRLLFRPDRSVIDYILENE